jgi:hypothetical protein
MKKLFWIMLLFLVIAGSCLDEPECLNMSNAHIGISFKKMFDGKADTIAFIGIQSLASDSIFYAFTRATAVQLPLNQFATQTQYTLVGAYSENSLTMNYENKSVGFISEDCGTRYLLSNLEFADYDFDSLKILTNTLTSSKQINLEVYRCPRTNLVKAAFRQIINTQERPDTVYLSNLSADFPTTFFIPNDTLSIINLPLNPNASSTTFFFDFKNGDSKSITFSYTRTDWNEFNSYCGTLTLFSELVSTAHDFNTIRISKDSIQDPPITNVAIFK